MCLIGFNNISTFNNYTSFVTVCDVDDVESISNGMQKGEFFISIPSYCFWRMGKSLCKRLPMIQPLHSGQKRKTVLILWRYSPMSILSLQKSRFFSIEQSPISEIGQRCQLNPPTCFGVFQVVTHLGAWEFSSLPCALHGISTKAFESQT